MSILLRPQQREATRPSLDEFSPLPYPYILPDWIPHQSHLGLEKLWEHELLEGIPNDPLVHPKV